MEYRTALWITKVAPVRFDACKVHSKWPYSNTNIDVKIWIMKMLEPDVVCNV